MIKLNGDIVKQNTFPDGSLLLKIDYSKCSILETILIEWYFENNSELWTLYVLTKQLQSNGYSVRLFMPYCPNSRQDRTKNKEDVFTLKWFAEIINSLNFQKVKTLDMHSDVGLALINNIECLSVEKIILEVIDRVYDKHPDDNIVLYFPDLGCEKRLSSFFKCSYIIGNKKRNWETGKIVGLDIITNGIDLNGKTVLMLDDIVSYGGSLYHSALKLKELGVKNIYAYVSHAEDSVLDKERGTLIKLLENSTVKKLFTTNSIFTGEHEKIEVLKL